MEDAFIEMLPFILIFAILLIVYVVITKGDYPANFTISLADDRIYYKRENYGLIKFPCTKIDYNNIQFVHESLECPRELIIGIRNHRSIVGEDYIKIWASFNGKYIENQRRVQEEADKAVKNYDGYVN